MATFTLFDEALKYLGDGTIDLDSHSIKAALTNTAPSQGSNTVLADITQIASSGGYTTGGLALTVTWTETGSGTGIWTFNVSANPAWTASGGSIATHRYMVVYDDTSTSPAPIDALIGYVDRGSSDIISSGNTRTWSVGANGLFQMDATP